VAAGFETERWTVPRIATVIQRTFGVRYHPRSLGPALRARGWSRQVPLARARERDEALIAAWLTQDWPRIKRGLADLGAPSSSSTRRATPSARAWAPRGRRGAARPSCAA
jgi:putative transposase